MKVAGFVLTGGRSTRMGRDKALLPVGGRLLCEHIAGVVGTVAEEVFLMGRPERYAHLQYKSVADLRPDCGPLSGLETALAMSRADFNIVASCDLFNVNAEWLRALLAGAEAGAHCAIARDAEGNLHPLCGVYRRECLPAVTRALSEGRWRMMDLLIDLGALPVQVNDVVLNLNTPREYDEIANAGRKL